MRAIILCGSLLGFEATALPAHRSGAAEDLFPRLDTLQGLLTRAEVTERLFRVYVAEDIDRRLIELTEDALFIRAADAEPFWYYRIAFAEKPATPGTMRPRSDEDASSRTEGESHYPLAGWRIVLDPGHLGGRWSRVEHRHFRIGDDPPIVEGDLVLQVAFLLEARLRALGAEVMLTRRDDTPVTPLRPEDFLEKAVARLEAGPRLHVIEEAVRSLANRLFYVSAENRARARMIGDWAPDFVVCLHIDAVPWPDPDHLFLVERDHMHVLVNGAYSALEIADPEQRVLMVERLLRGFDRVELPLAEALAEAMAEASGLPPFRYRGPNARRVSENPYVWARNLAANRLFPAPVVFLEPYVANSEVTYARLQAGDYDGTREVAGEMRQSIFREYADSVTAGILRYVVKAGSPVRGRLFHDSGLNP